MTVTIALWQVLLALAVIVPMAGVGYYAATEERGGDYFISMTPLVGCFAGLVSCILVLGVLLIHAWGWL